MSLASAAADPDLQAALLRLEGAWRSAGPAGRPWLEAMRAPLARADLRDRLRPWTARPAAAVATAYAWCDGLEDGMELSPGARWPGTAEAAADYGQRMAAAAAATAGSHVRADRVWDPRWWPLLTASDSSGGCWFWHGAALWHKDREDDPVLAHDSLAALVNMVSEGLRSGVLALQAPAVVEADADAAAALFRRHSPRAAGAADASLDAQRVRRELVARLASGDPRSQGEAAAVLIKRREREVVPELLPLLERPDPVVRRLAVRVLEAVPDRRALSPLMARLGDADAATRGHAAMALAALGDPGVAAALLAALRRSTPAEAPALMRALAMLNVTEAVDALGEHLSAAHPLPTRVSAASALAAMRHEKLSGLLLPLLHEPSPQLRAIAVSWLGRPGDAAAIAPLAAALRDEQLSVRVLAAGALAATGSPAAREALQLALQALPAPLTSAPASASTEHQAFVTALRQALGRLAGSA